MRGQRVTLDRYCQNVFDELGDIMGDKSENVHARYLRLYQVVRDRDKLLGRLFDGLSRGEAEYQLLGLRRKGLVEPDWLEGLTEDFLQATDPERLLR